MIQCNLLIFTATRETAFLHAISSAAITHEITLQCARNRIPGCRCGKTRKQLQGDREWEWGGCSDNTKYGEKETRRFIDRLEKGNDARTAFNLHNNQVGRKVNWLDTIYPSKKIGKCVSSPILRGRRFKKLNELCYELCQNSNRRNYLKSRPGWTKVWWSCGFLKTC